MISNIYFNNTLIGAALITYHGADGPYADNIIKCSKFNSFQ